MIWVLTLLAGLILFPIMRMLKFVLNLGLMAAIVVLGYYFRDDIAGFASTVDLVSAKDTALTYIQPAVSDFRSFIDWIRGFAA